MRSKKLILKKEIVANLSDTESNQLKGGTGDTTCWSDCTCWMTTNGPICDISNASCLCGGGSDGGATSCCGDTYANCSNCGC